MVKIELKMQIEDKVKSYEFLNLKTLHTTTCYLMDDLVGEDGCVLLRYRKDGMVGWIPRSAMPELP